jgi:predicted RNase H-like nuclease (RuvC/YqgF family)
MEHPYYIGIDPGIKTGMALWHKNKGFIWIKTLKLHSVFHHFELATQGSDFKVFIENPNTYVPFNKTSSAAQDARRQGAGAVKQTYKHIIEYLEDYKIPYQPTRLQGGLKKVSSEFFKKQTGWKESTDVHSRDAALLIYGR